MQHRNIACIDLGTHTARLLIAQLDEATGDFKPLVRMRRYVRLATAPGAAIEPRAAENAIQELRFFSEKIRQNAVTEVHGAATGILRMAPQGKILLRRITSLTGLHLRLLSGEEEARLSARGALQALPPQREPAVVLDLGGGSLEFQVIGSQLQQACSLPLGAALLSRLHLHHDPPTGEELRTLNRIVDHSLESSGIHFPQGVRPWLIGTGGTVTALAAQKEGVAVGEISPERLNGCVLDSAWLKDCSAWLAALPFKRRCELPALDEGRAEVIVAGAAVLARVDEFFGAPGILVSLWDLLEGMLFEACGWRLK